MLIPKALQTADSNELTFFCRHSYVAWGGYRLNKFKHFLKHFFAVPRATPGPSASVF